MYGITHRKEILSNGLTALALPYISIPKLIAHMRYIQGIPSSLQKRKTVMPFFNGLANGLQTNEVDSMVVFIF